MDHFTYMKNAAAYVERSPDPQRKCHQCDHFTDQGVWQRCDKGGFFVRRTGTCKHFDAANVGATS